MMNSGTVTAGASGSGSSTVSQGYDRFWQQFVLSAYAATATNGTPASSSTSISA
jgi:hypothetical protein